MTCRLSDCRIEGFKHLRLAEITAISKLFDILSKEYKAFVPSLVGRASDIS